MTHRQGVLPGRTGTHPFAVAAVTAPAAHPPARGRGR
jgi:hypothetical protein